jgi:hypothetical protein
MPDKKFITITRDSHLSYCFDCSGVMMVVAFIEPPQALVIKKILKHCGLWQQPVSRPPPDVDGLVQDLDLAFSTKRNRHPQPDHAQDLIYEDIDTFPELF